MKMTIDEVVTGMIKHHGIYEIKPLGNENSVRLNSDFKFVNDYLKPFLKIDAVQAFWCKPEPRKGEDRTEWASDHAFAVSEVLKLVNADIKTKRKSSSRTKSLNTIVNIRKESLNN